MAGEVKLEILFGRSIYVLTRANCERVLALLDADAELGELLSVLREDLRKALAADAAAQAEAGVSAESQEPEVTEEVAVNLAQVSGEAQANDNAPRCHACGGPGRRLPAEPGDTEALWVCDAPDCWRRGMPAARRFFESGIR